MVERKVIPTEVYIAGPLFNPQENSHNKTLAQLFRDEGYTVFNPIEDGIEGAVVENMEEDELLATIFELDRSKVRGSRIFVANLNGAQVDDGTAVEIGIASESQRGNQDGIEVMIAYFSDSRSLTSTMRRNPMVMGPFLREPNRVFSITEEVVNYARDNFPPQHEN